MGRYSSYARRPPRPPRGIVHPVMRGIGCIMIVLVPILSYGLAVLLVNYGLQNGWPIPPNWLGAPTFHPLLWRLTGLATVLEYLTRQTNLIAHIVFTIALIIVMGGVMSVIYGYFYQIFGPPRYGPTDVPPPKVKARPYKR